MKTLTRNWIITFLCSGLYFLHYGIGRMSSQLFPATMMAYNVNRKKASFPYFWHYSVRFLSGPLAGYLGQRFGPCLITLSAVILSSFGISLCYFAENVTTLTALWGGLSGFSSGIGTHLLAEILERNWNRRSLAANGISVAGASVGAVILPIVVANLLAIYGIHGCFLLLGGIMLHGIPIGMFLLNLDADSQRANQIKTAKAKIKTENYKESLVKQNISIININDRNELTKIPNVSGKDINEFKRQNSMATNQNIGEKCDNISIFNVNSNSYDVSNVNKTNKDNVITKTIDGKCVNANTQAYKTTSMKSFKVFCDTVFIFLLINQGLFMIVNITVLTVVIDYCKDLGLNEYHQIIILTVHPIADFLGRMLLGFVVDKTFISAVQFTSIMFLLMASGLFLLTFVKDALTLSFCVMFYGFCSGGCFATSPGIFSENLEKSKLPMAYASRFILYFPLSLAQSPVMGFFRSHFNSYRYLFYLCGVIQLINCILIFFTKKVNLSKSFQLH